MSRFDVVNAYAAYGDWWNVGGLTARCRAKGRSISGQLHAMRYCYGSDDYFERGSPAEDIYLALVRRWEGDEAYQEEIAL